MSKKSKKQKEKLWLRQFFNRQKDINGYARKVLAPRAREDVIHVFHPEEYRRWLVHGPCRDCPVCKFCDQPCQAYLNWYDQRMTLARQLLSR